MPLWARDLPLSEGFSVSQSGFSLPEVYTIISLIAMQLF